MTMDLLNSTVTEASCQPESPVTSIRSPKPFYHETDSELYLPGFQADIGNADKKGKDPFGQSFGLTNFSAFPKPVFPCFEQQFNEGAFGSFQSKNSYIK
jgi:hypothetical protein